MREINKATSPYILRAFICHIKRQNVTTWSFISVWFPCLQRGKLLVSVTVWLLLLPAWWIISPPGQRDTKGPFLILSSHQEKLFLPRKCGKNSTPFSSKDSSHAAHVLQQEIWCFKICACLVAWIHTSTSPNTGLPALRTVNHRLRASNWNAYKL